MMAFAVPISQHRKAKSEQLKYQYIILTPISILTTDFC